ncbi:MAG: ribonuclease P protein component [Emcibacteraceae bacterium]|nr:ribonuclease P protein component [Emcibacteraceae bacterium]
MSQVTENKELKLETLRKRSDFLRVAAVRKKWITPGMIIQVSPMPDDVKSDIRVGYTASKKVGNAVIRNRAKRRMREVTRQIMAKNACDNHDYVIIARREINDIPFKELIRDLKWSLKRLHDGLEKKRNSIH